VTRAAIRRTKRAGERSYKTQRNRHGNGWIAADGEARSFFWGGVVMVEFNSAIAYVVYALIKMK
jgi:hypothetical protein